MKKLYYLLLAMMALSAVPSLAQQTLTVMKKDGTKMVCDLDNVDSLVFGKWKSLRNQFAVNDNTYDIQSAGQLITTADYIYTLQSADAHTLTVQIPQSEFGVEQDFSEGSEAVVKVDGVERTFTSGTLEVSKPKFGTNLIISLSALDLSDRIRAEYNGAAVVGYDASMTYSVKVATAEAEAGQMKHLFVFDDADAGATDFVFGTAADATTGKSLQEGDYTVIVKVPNSVVGTTIDLASDKNDYSITLYDNKNFKEVELPVELSGILKTARTAENKAYLYLDASYYDNSALKADFFGDTIRLASLDEVIPQAPEVNGCWVVEYETGQKIYTQEGFGSVTAKTATYGSKTMTITFHAPVAATNDPVLRLPAVATNTLVNAGSMQLTACPYDSWEFTQGSMDIYSNSDPSSSSYEYKKDFIPTKGSIKVMIDSTTKTMDIYLEAHDTYTKQDVKLVYKGTYTE